MTRDVHTPLQRGLVAITAFPLTDGITSKIRPVVLISSENWASVDALVIVASITSSVSRLDDPGTVALTSWADAGLDLPSAVQTRRLFTTQARFFNKMLGTVAKHDMDAIRAQVSTFLTDIHRQ